MLQRVIGAVLVALGVLSAALAVASATVWRPDDVVTASSTSGGAATLLVVEPGVLDLVSDEVTVDRTLEKSGRDGLPPSTLEKSGLLVLLTRASFPRSGAVKLPRPPLRKHRGGVSAGHWRALRRGAGVATPAVARHGLMSSPPRRV